MSKTEITAELEKKIYDIIDSEMNEIKRELTHYEYVIDHDRYINVVGNDYYVKLIITIYTKFFEISEHCSNLNSNILYEKELSEEELEKLYDQCYEETLNEINEEYAIDKNIEIETNEYEITSYILKCEGDYCKVGGELNITIKSVDLNDIKHLMYYLKDIIRLYIEL